MRKATKLLLATLAAALLLTVMVGTASANRLSISETDFRFNWTRLTFEIESVGQRITCEISLSGSFHNRTLVKTIGLLIGIVHRASLGRCDGDARATVLVETLPWHLRYNGFTASRALPFITGMKLTLVGMGLAVNDGGFCLIRTDSAEPGGHTMIVDPSTGQVDGVDADETFEIDLEDAFLCEFIGDSKFESVTPATASTQEVAEVPAVSTLEFTPGGEIALDSLLEITFTGGELSMTCDWTLTGSLTRGAIRRTEGATVGSISSTAFDHCGGGSVERVLSTPWSIKYVRATGTVPGSVTAVTLKVEGYAVNLRTFGANVGCLYRGDLSGTLELSGANPYPTGLWRLAESRLTFVSGAGGCPASITATGTYWLGVEQAIRFVETEARAGRPAALIFIRLI